MIYASHYIPSFANVTGFIGRGRRHCCHQYQPLASRAVTDLTESLIYSQTKKKIRLLGEFRGRIEKISSWHRKHLKIHQALSPLWDLLNAKVIILYSQAVSHGTGSTDPPALSSVILMQVQSPYCWKRNITTWCSSRLSAKGWGQVQHRLHGHSVL